MNRPTIRVKTFDGMTDGTAAPCERSHAGQGDAVGLGARYRFDPAEGRGEAGLAIRRRSLAPSAGNREDQ